MTISSENFISYSHLPTAIKSPNLPLLIRTMDSRDNAAFAAILSDFRNTMFESNEIPKQMELEAASKAIERQRASASQPTVVSARTGKVIRGPSRVNMVIVYLGENNEEGHAIREKGGLIIGLGGFGSIKDLDTCGKPVPEVQGQSRNFLRIGDVGVMINYEYRRRGFAQEAIRLAMEWGFQKAANGGLQLDEITAATMAANKPMVGLFEKKMMWEGTSRIAEEMWVGEEERRYKMSLCEWDARNTK